MAEQGNPQQVGPDGSLPLGPNVVARVESIVFLPSGKPAPYVLDESDLIAMLRLKRAGARKTIAGYRRRGMLRGIKMGWDTVYLLKDVLDFLGRKD